MPWPWHFLEEIIIGACLVVKSQQGESGDATMEVAGPSISYRRCISFLFALCSSCCGAFRRLLGKTKMAKRWGQTKKQFPKLGYVQYNMLWPDRLGSRIATWSIQKGANKPGALFWQMFHYPRLVFIFAPCIMRLPVPHAAGRKLPQRTASLFLHPFFMWGHCIPRSTSAWAPTSRRQWKLLWTCSLRKASLMLMSGKRSHHGSLRIGEGE